MTQDVVLVDIDLGEENGFDVVAQLAARVRGADVAPQLILMSSHNREDLEELIMESSARGFVSKSELSAAAIRFVLGDGAEPASVRPET